MNFSVGSSLRIAIPTTADQAGGQANGAHPAIGPGMA